MDASSWSCSCPDHHRRGEACKHGLAAWVLWRASLTRQEREHIDRVEEINDRVQGGSCDACHGSWVYLDEDVIDPESGEVSKVHNPVRCRSCAPATPPHLTDEELREWMDSVPWRFAKTMPQHPHFYSLRGWNDEELFERVVLTVWDRGYDPRYLQRPWRSLDVGEHYIWIAGAPPKPGDPAPVETTVLINRALRVQERLGEGA